MITTRMEIADVARAQSPNDPDVTALPAHPTAMAAVAAKPHDIHVHKLVQSAADGGVVVSSGAASALATLGSKPIFVVAVMGALRSGKSTLQSIIASHAASGGAVTPSIADTSAGGPAAIFKASASGSAVTAGIDVAVIPRPAEPTDLVLLDIEGTGDKSAKHDMQLAVVAAMLSSVLVLNTKGAPGREDMLGRLGFLAKAAKAVSSGSKHDGSDGRLGESLIVLARDYELDHGPDAVRDGIFSPEDDDDDDDDDDEALNALRRNKARSQLRAAYGSCSALLLPLPDGRVSHSGASFGEAMRDSVVPAIMDGSRTPTSAPGRRGAPLSAASLGDAAAALCAAVSTPRFRELVPSSVADAMDELAAARWRQRLADYAEAARAAVHGWVAGRRGVPTAAVSEALGMVEAEARRILAEAVAAAPSKAADLEAAMAAKLAAAREEVEAEANDQRAGRRMEAERLLGEAASEWAWRELSLDDAVRSTLTRLDACTTLEAVDGVRAPQAEGGNAAGVSAAAAICEAVSRELASLDASHELGSPGDLSEEAMAAAAFAVRHVQELAAGASTARRIALELMHSVAAVPREWRAGLLDAFSIDRVLASLDD